MDKADREKFKAIKKRIMAKEQDNFSRLYVFPSGKTWYKMGWNSALVYKYLLAPKMKVDANLRPDRDFEHVSRPGVISFQNLKALEERLAGVGVKKERVYEGVWIFKLETETSEKELQRLSDKEAAKWKQAGAALMKQDMVPEIWKNLRMMTPMVVNAFKAAPEPLRDYIERDIALTHKEMMLDYVDLSNRAMEWKEYYPKTQQHLYRLKKFLRVAMEAKTWELKKVIRLTEMMYEIEANLDTEQKKRNASK